MQREAAGKSFRLLSPGDATVVQPLLPSHNDVEPATKIVWLHVHDLMTKHVI